MSVLVWVLSFLMNCRDFGRRVKLLLSTSHGSFGIHPRHTTFSPRSNDLASLCHWRPGLNREICCWGHYAVNLGIQQKNTDSTFHHLSHVSRRKWRSKRRVLGFLWLLGTNFVGLAGETSFTPLNLSRKIWPRAHDISWKSHFSEWYVFFFWWNFWHIEGWRW